MPSQIGIARYRTVCSSLPKPAHDRKPEPRAMITAVRIVYIIILEFLILCSVNSQEIISLNAHAAACCSFSKRTHRVTDPANCTESACVASVRWFDRSDMQLNEIGKDTVVDC